MKLVGVVGIKVRPDTRGFRDRADKELRRQLGGRDNAHSVPMRLDPEFDERELKRKFDEHKRHLNGHLKDLQKSVERQRLAPFKVDGEPEKEVVKPLTRVRQEYLKHRKLMLSDLARLNKEQEQLRDKDLRNEKRFAYRMRALARTERIKRGSKLDENGSFGLLATQLPLVLRRMMRETEDAFKDPANDFRKAIRDAVRDVRNETSRVKAAGFEDMRDTLRGLNAELDRTRGLFRFAEDLDLGDDLGALRRQLKDVSGSYVRALEDARRFRAEYDRLDTLDKERLRVGFTAKDNAAIEAAEERIRALRRELAAMGSADLHRFWKDHADGSREYAEALAEVERRRQKLARVQSGWQTMDSVFAKQGRDNRRVDAEAAAHFRKIREEADRTQRHIDGLTGTMKVELDGTAAVAAHLKWLSRPRSVPLHVRVSATSAVIAEGLLKSFAGMNVTKKMGDMLERALRDFDKFTVGAGAVVSAVMTISNSLFAGVGALAGIGKGVVQVLQGVAMAPTILGAVATGFTVATTATLDFFKALKDGNYEGLTDNARKTAEALKGTWTELSDTIKEDFWSEAGTAMSDFILKAMPTLSRGLGKTATAMGRAWNNVFKAFEHSLDVGYMDRMFDGLVETTGEVAKAAGPAMRAIMQLGARGAEHLPRLGRWMTRNAEAFERFIDKADRSGRIDQWINNSIDSMYALWDVGRGTWRVLEGMADAALKAGGPSLRDFADGMMRLGDSFKSVRGQAIMGDIFEGAFKGFGSFMDGFKDMLGALGRNSGWIRDIESLSGKVMGQVARNLGTIFDDRTFQKGTISALDDLHLGLIRLRPASKNIAGIIGNLGRLGGAVFKGIAPTIDRVTGLVDTAIKNMVEPLVDVIPTITHGMGAIFNTLRGPVDAVSSIAGGAIKTFNGLPATIQQAVVAAGALLALRPHLQSFGGAIASKLVPSYTSLGRQADALMRVAENSGRPIGRATATWRAWKQEMQHTAHLMGSRAMIRPFRDIEVAAATADRVMSRAGMKTYLYDAYQGLGRMRDGMREAGREVRRMGGDIRAAFTAPIIAGGNAGGLAGVRDKLRGVAEGTAAVNRAMRGERMQQFQTGLVGVAAGAGTAARALGKTAGSGLLKAAAGVMGALGGPWGLAISAAVVGLSTLGQKAAEAKERVSQIGSTLDGFGGVTVDTHRAMADMATGRGGYGDLIGTARKYGIAEKDVQAAMLGSTEARERAVDQMRKAQEAQTDLSKAGEGAMGVLAAQEGQVQKFERGLKNAAKELEEAQEKQRTFKDFTKSLGEEMGVSGQAAAKMSTAWDQLRKTAEFASVSGKELFGTLDTLTGGTVSAADAAYNLESSMAASRKALSDWGKTHSGNMGKVTKNLFDANGAFDMTKQSTRDLYAILRQQVEPAFDSVATAFNNMGGGEAGARAAREQMGEIRKAMFDNLTSIEGMSSESANKILDNLNIKPDAIEMVLDKANFETNVADIANSLKLLTGETQRVDVEVSSQGFDPLMSDARNAQDMLTALTSPMYRTMLEAEDRVSPVVGKIDTELEQMVVRDWLAMVSATDNASGTIAGVRSALDAGFNNKTYQAVLDVLDNASGLSMTAKNKIMAGFVQGDYEAVLKAVDEAGPVGDKVRDKLKGIFNGDQYRADLDAEDKATPKTQKVADAIDRIDSKEATVTIAVKGMESIDNLSSRIGSLKDKDLAVKVAVRGDDAIGRITTKMGNLRDKSVAVKVTNTGADGIARLKSRIDAVRGKSAKVSVSSSGAGPLAQLKSRIDAIKPKSARVNVSASGAGPLAQLKSRIDAIRSKRERVEVNSKGAGPLAQLKSRIDAIKPKSVTVSASTSGEGAVHSLRNAISSVRGKTVTVRVNTVGSVSKALADGGILDGAGVQRFANGGFNIAKYANGGTRERHVAQFAPAGAYRVWAEQETGGEAYIPLAQSKRSRSERILSEVAHRFGGEFRKFANGSHHSRPVTTGGDHYTVNISAIPEDQADRVANDTLFALKHLRRGGGAGVYA